MKNIKTQSHINSNLVGEARSCWNGDQANQLSRLVMDPYSY